MSRSYHDSKGSRKTHKQDKARRLRQVKEELATREAKDTPPRKAKHRFYQHVEEER